MIFDVDRLDLLMYQWMISMILEIGIGNVDFEMIVRMYNHWSLFDDSMKIVDFDKLVELWMLIRKNYFDEVEVENLLVAIQTINKREKQNKVLFVILFFDY